MAVHTCQLLAGPCRSSHFLSLNRISLTHFLSSHIRAASLPQVDTLEAELAGRDTQVALLMEAQRSSGSMGSRGGGHAASNTLAQLTEQVGRQGPRPLCAQAAVSLAQ